MFEDVEQVDALRPLRWQRIDAVTAEALLLFERRGWDDVSRAEICRAAGVSETFMINHFVTKRIVALAAYAPALSPLVTRTESVIMHDAVTKEEIKTFVHAIADIFIEYPVLALALLPASRDNTGEHEGRVSDMVTYRDFPQLANLMGRLLDSWKGNNLSGDEAMHVSQLYLGGLLLWVIVHPDHSAKDAARIVLSQLL